MVFTCHVMQSLSARLGIATESIHVTWKGAGTTAHPDATLLRSIGFYSGTKLLVSTGPIASTVPSGDDTHAESHSESLVPFSESDFAWGGDLGGMKTPPRPAPSGGDAQRYSAAGLLQLSAAASPSTPSQQRGADGTTSGTSPVPNTTRGLLLSALNRSPGKTPPAVVSAAGFVVRCVTHHASCCGRLTDGLVDCFDWLVG